MNYSKYKEQFIQIGTPLKQVHQNKLAERRTATEPF